MIYLDELLQATGGRLIGPAGATQFSDFSYDSRITRPGQLFLAVVTETGDGHDFIAAAVAAGAAGVVCQRPPVAEIGAATCILVENTQQALLDYARYILARHPVAPGRALSVIGVTGSVGKTSTKEAVAAVLGRRYAVFRNPGSYNGRYGLPIALGGLEREHQLAVLEMAADSWDEIRHLADVTRPRVAIVTAVEASHLQMFGSLDRIAEEKACLVEALPPDGLAILNADDPRVLAMRARTRARVVTFGLSAQADLWADRITVSAEGTRLTVHQGAVAEPVSIPLLGRHHAYTALAAVAAGLAFDVSWEDIREGLARAEPLPGRTRLLPGVGGAMLLDDSYNAGAASALAAIETLRELPASRRVMVLGDMAQLGDEAEATHRAVGRAAAPVADLLVTIGELAHLAADAAVAAGKRSEQVLVAYTHDDALRLLTGVLRRGDLVLIKGSAEARMETLTAGLLAEPERAGELLPRQGRGWQQVQLQHPGRPTWVEIDLEAIAHNVRRVVASVGPEVAVMAVLKADGYGHGAVKVARTALNNGVRWLGVACLGEAITLRQSGVQAPILNLGYTPAWQARGAVLHGVVSTVYALDTAAALSRAGRDLGRTARVHVKVDTGMGRLGLLCDEVSAFLRQARGLPALQIEGLYTHFSSADEADLDYTRFQLAAFEGLLAELRRDDLLPPLIHAANSAATLRMPASHYHMVRLGIAMYGLNASVDAPCPPDFRPALSFKCQVAQVKALPEGSYVGYGRAFRTARPSRIAVIPVGYADGFRRGPTHWGVVLVRGQRAPLVGRVCMDQTMIDVTDIPGVRQGDEVVLIGRQGAEEITVDEVARQLGTINYEIVSEILARVPRVV